MCVWVGGWLFCVRTKWSSRSSTAKVSSGGSSFDISSDDSPQKHVCTVDSYDCPAPCTCPREGVRVGGWVGGRGMGMMDAGGRCFVRSRGGGGGGVGSHLPADAPRHHLLQRVGQRAQRRRGGDAQAAVHAVDTVVVVRLVQLGRGRRRAQREARCARVLRRRREHPPRVARAPAVPALEGVASSSASAASSSSAAAAAAAAAQGSGEAAVGRREPRDVVRDVDEGGRVLHERREGLVRLAHQLEPLRGGLEVEDDLVEGVAAQRLCDGGQTRRTRQAFREGSSLRSPQSRAVALPRRPV